MSEIFDDSEYSFNNPKNQGNGKLVPLSTEDPLYSIIKKEFIIGWKHSNKKKPQLQAMYKILWSDMNLKPYIEYRELVATLVASSFVVRDWSMNLANEQLLFHGTNRYCQLAEDGRRLRLCDLPACHLCCIVRNSFDINKCGIKNKFRRFGTGIYFTSCSSKADDYTLNGDESSRYRVLLVSRVVVGNSHKRRQNATNMIEPPFGYHSVIGEPGIDLNYEETVVYDNDAIRPAFLIVYGDTPLKSKLQSKALTFLKTLLAS